MRLAQFISANHDSIIAQWVAFAGTMRPWAEGMTEQELTDHANEILTAVVMDMTTPQSDTQQREKSTGNAYTSILAKAGRQHASERLESGLNLTQLVSEFRALRASVLRLWEAEQGGDQGTAQDDVTRFNESIDEALSISTTHYAETVQSTRDQFVGILGHDLRNPLGAVTMGASFLARSEDETTRSIAAQIQRSAERMNRMISDLLDLTRSRLGAGIPVVRVEADLGPVCRQVVSELRAGRPGRDIHFDSQGELRGEWDCDRLAQALSNLIANAMQHGSHDSQVSVRGLEAGESIALRIHNTGKPIPENEQRRIFNPLARCRTDGTVSENADGLGLGLFIASEIVTAHGGTIEVTSSAAEGTTFTMNLPRSPAAGVAAV
jgi:hypothetical protein